MAEGGYMSGRYLVQISQSQIMPVTVVASTPQEAIERALRGEGNPGDSRGTSIKARRKDGELE